MPTYEYICECGVQFDGRASVADRKKPKTCPDCGEAAERVPPSMVSGQFKKDVDGAGPQNTGIHDLDTHIDRVLGQSAVQGWRVVENRVRDKQAVMAAEGVDGHHVRRNPDGSYGVIKPEEEAVHKRVLKIHKKAGEWQRAERKKAERKKAERKVSR